VIIGITDSSSLISNFPMHLNLELLIIVKQNMCVTQPELCNDKAFFYEGVPLSLNTREGTSQRLASIRKAGRTCNSKLRSL